MKPVAILLNEEGLKLFLKNMNQMEAPVLGEQEPLKLDKEVDELVKEYDKAKKVAEQSKEELKKESKSEYKPDFQRYYDSLPEIPVYTPPKSNEYNPSFEEIQAAPAIKNDIEVTIKPIVREKNPAKREFTMDDRLKAVNMAKEKARKTAGPEIKAVIDILRTNGGPMRLFEISEQLKLYYDIDWGTNSATTKIQRLMKYTTQIVSAGHGEYKYNPDGTDI